MTGKTKRQLRAEAVERLECMDEWCDGTKTAADFVKALLWDLRVIDGEHVRDALVDLLADDEPPEGDAVSIMRKALDNRASPTFCALARYLKISGGLSVSWHEAEDALRMLADMVERDYVRREAYDDLCDEFVWTNSFLHRVGKQCGTKDVPSLKAYVEQLEARVGELEAVDRRTAEADARWEAAIRDLESMAAERDYWKQQVQACMDAAHPPSHSPERRYAPEVMDYPVGDGCTTPATLVSAEIDGLRDERSEQYMGILAEVSQLTAERDEWKAKAERSNDGARRGMTNLEWHFRHDDGGFGGTVIAAAQIRRFCPDGCEAPQQVGEWLMAEHVDADGTTDGTCPDAMGQSSDDCGHCADMSGKAPDRVREEPGMSGVREHSMEPESGQRGAGSDTREELEADVRDHFWHNDWCRTEMVFGWLDRQAAITERECREYEDALREQHHERMDELRAERDRYRDMCGRMLDAARGPDRPRRLALSPRDC